MVQFQKKRFNYYLSFASYGLILYLSLMCVPENIPETINIGDKWTHFLMYGFLTTMVIIDRLIHQEKTYNPKKLYHYLTTPQSSFKVRTKTDWLYPTLWGVLMECFQGMTTYRSFSFLDMAANTIGTTLALLIAISIIRCFKKTIR